jgi:hypothetical protein
LTFTKRRFTLSGVYQKSGIGKCGLKIPSWGKLKTEQASTANGRKLTRIESLALIRVD